jgi:hypothetical protein
MKRTSLTTAVIAGIAGVAGISNMASAVYLNQDGLGQVLVYPYYTVNAGNSTIVTVVNTTDAGKAVKVRFLEAYDSREVLDFNLYLSPHDWWGAQVVPVGSGAGVFTNDNSCTVPALPKTGAAAQAFSTYAFDGTLVANDGGPKTAARTLEGYVELIEMGTVVNDDFGTLDAITHSNGVPASCAQVVKAWSGGYWNSNAAYDIDPPTGGLFGSGTIVNVQLGTVEGYNADAVDQFYLPTDVATHHTTPTSLSPSIASATASTSYVFAPSPVSSVPTLVTTAYQAGIDAVSSLFMADSVYNEYWTGGGAGANSEWVVTFPTKRFYVDPSQAIVGFQKPFDVLFTSTLGGTSCAPIAVNAYDREEGALGTSIGFSPAPPGGNSLCYEAQVVTFNQPTVVPGVATAVLGSKLGTNIPTPSNNGWALIDLAGASPNHILPASYTQGSSNQFEGLPVTGFWVAQFVNNNIGGVLSNYTSLYRHKLHRTCANATTGLACS